MSKIEIFNFTGYRFVGILDSNLLLLAANLDDHIPFVELEERSVGFGAVDATRSIFNSGVMFSRTSRKVYVEMMQMYDASKANSRLPDQTFLNQFYRNKPDVFDLDHSMNVRSIYDFKWRYRYFPFC
jgi:alpha-N-acetylglucosamine transferase